MSQWTLLILVAASMAKGDGDHSSPAGSSYLPPTAASNGYGAPQASYGGGNDYYDDYEEDQQPSYSENQVGTSPTALLNTKQPCQKICNLSEIRIEITPLHALQFLL